MQAELNKFLTSYQKAFDDFSAPEIVAHYQLPCLILDADGLMTFDNFAQINDKFEVNCKKMKTMGYSGSDFLINSFKKLGKDKVMIDVLWTVNLVSGPFQFGTVYLCFSNNDHWKIFNATVYYDD